MATTTKTKRSAASGSKAGSSSARKASPAAIRRPAAKPAGKPVASGNGAAKSAGVVVKASTPKGVAPKGVAPKGVAPKSKAPGKVANKPEAAAPAKPAKSSANDSVLCKKLGIVAGHTVVLIDAPLSFPGKLEPLPAGVELRHSAMRGAGFDLAVLFVPNQNTLNRRFSQLAKLMRPHGAVWVAWPGKTSGFSCDVSEEGARVVAGKDGLVDDKTAVLDPVWTGMRFVARVPGASVITELK